MPFLAGRLAPTLTAYNPLWPIRTWSTTPGLVVDDTGGRRHLVIDTTRARRNLSQLVVDGDVGIVQEPHIASPDETARKSPGHHGHGGAQRHEQCVHLPARVVGEQLLRPERVRDHEQHHEHESAAQVDRLVAGQALQLGTEALRRLVHDAVRKSLARCDKPAEGLPGPGDQQEDYRTGKRDRRRAADGLNRHDGALR